MVNKNIITRILILLCILFFIQSQVAWAETAKSKYFKADASYKKLRNSSKKQKYRENWLMCIKKYEAVFRHNPSGPWAAAGLYKAGILYYELYKKSYKKSDKKEALDIFERVIKRYPKSKYSKRSSEQIRQITKKRSQKAASKRKLPTKKKVLVKKKISLPQKKLPVKTSKKSVTKTPTTGKTTVKDLRFWSNPNYTRIVIDADRETSYVDKLLKKDPSINKPQRLLVDLSQSRLGKNLSKFFPINDNLLKDARAGQYKPDIVRVVIDIKSFKNYKIFSLNNPFRIVIDVWGKGSDKKYIAKTSPKSSSKTKKNNKKIPHSAIAKQLALGVKRIVIDPGHGGRDYGAPGYYKGVHERDIALKLAQKLSAKIRKELNCETILTRNNNKFLTLEERTAIANTKNADLFISLHANASRDRRAYGIETYFLNLATDDESIRVAAKENATSTKNISDLQSILSDLMQNAKINESSRLATHVQGAMYRKLKTKYGQVKNKGVKQAPFYVLLGAQMPAILIETGFISNTRECKRLTNAIYQDRLCDAIIHGIKNYIKDTNPTAFIRSQPMGKNKS